MRRREPLRALQILRRVEAQDARLRLMEARMAQDQAALALQHHLEALHAEAGNATGQAFAIWLPAARAGGERAAAGLAAAEAQFAAARSAAASAGLAEKTTTDEVLRRKRMLRATRQEREQNQLGDLVPAPDPFD